MNAPDGESSKKPKLTPKQRRFVEEYASDPNAVQAYFRAFGRTKPNGVKRSYKAAQVQASRLLEIPIIAKEIEIANAAYCAATGISKRRVLREIANLAFVDPSDAYDVDPNGGPLIAKKLHDIPAGTRRAIQSVKVKRRRLLGGGDETYEVEEVEYKFASKLDALEKLCKKLGFFKDKEEEQKANAGVPVELLTRIFALAGTKPVQSGGVEPTPEKPAVDS